MTAAGDRMDAVSTGHDHPEVRSRLAGSVDLEDGHIEVEHVFDNSVCPDHGGLASKGLVSLTVHLCDHEDDGSECDGETVTVLLGASQALLLQNRLGRAVNMVLEAEEGLPDIEREMLRHSEPQPESG